MGLIVFGVVFVGVWIHIEGFEVIAVDYSTDWLVCVGPSITLWCCYAVVLLEFGVGEYSRVWS